MVLIGIVYCGVFLYINKALPPPFFFEPSDTYADWFNTAFWSRNSGAYDTWKTVYPPLSFLFVRVLGLDRCYPTRRPYDFSAGLDARDCDWVGMASIWLIVLINIVLVYLAYRKLDRQKAIPRTICVALGLPMLDALERGNLALITFTCLLLALGPLLKSARLRWIAAGLTVNFKIYLIAAIIPLVLKRRWRWVESALISVVIVYLLSYAAFGRGSLFELAQNIRDFADAKASNILDVWYTTTYKSLIALLDSDTFPLAMIIGSRNVELLGIIVPTLAHTTQALLLLAFAAIALRPEPVPSYRVAALAILLVMVTSEAGGYSQIYFMLFVMMEPWRGFGRRWAVIACYILAIPLDIIVDKTPAIATYSYLGGGPTFINYFVTIGPFIRPLLIMTIAWALSLVTIRQVWGDVRIQGWANRWRFRHDVPLLPGVRAPEPPTLRQS